MEENDPFATEQPPEIPTTAPRDELPPSPLGDAPSVPMARAQELASPGKRLLARIVDGLVFFIPALIIAVAVGSGWIGTAVMTVVYGIYEIFMISNRGQTIGKMALSIKVVDETTGAVPSMEASAMRYGLPGGLSLIPWIGGILSLVVYLSILWRDRKQGFHDTFAKTLVVDA